ncbi:squalene monooxygenase [Pimephales promelas]|nr:squalene monooxygenase [Pimephales promelas]
MSVALNDVMIWRSLLQNVPDLSDNAALLQIQYYCISSKSLLVLFSAGRGVCLGASWTAVCAEPPPLDTDWSRGLFKHQGRGKTGPSRSAAEEHGNSLSCVCHHISSSLF